ncbi:hypothetical protein D910_00254 [Dendroctonus ponderosae]|uniref:Peptidase S1 domain-containing protein n=1 Tax=Dendroctonus ponderosae TaxID=77166 RepID=U4UZC5_DENPD|nr:hypothetical protein D910_00254 [Dendroctonus ponderosae]
MQGDSGGPLQIRKNNRYYLIGIPSVGLQCGQVNVPGVYTWVASYLPWIQQYIFIELRCLRKSSSSVRPWPQTTKVSST